MSVSIRVRNDEWLVGAGSFLFSFFSTVRVRLEPEGWGSRFPAVMNELYTGELLPRSASTALGELELIRAGLREFPPSDLVWDCEDPSKRPPWGDAISPDITDLSECFVTSDGRDLLDVLGEALSRATSTRSPLRIQ